jgi:hypothetical protein
MILPLSVTLGNMNGLQEKRQEVSSELISLEALPDLVHLSG